MAFGVKTANMFELLGEGDSDDVPQTSVKPQAEPKKSAPVAAGAANVEARLKGATNGPVNGGRGGRGEGRGGRGEGRGGRGGRGRGFDRPPREEGQGEGGELGERGPGSRPFRGRGGERHYERDRRRGYDRHDNTGRGHETEKRGGGGGHNWGAVGEETPAAVEEVVAEEEKIDEIVEGEASAAAETEGDAQAAEPTEPKEPEKEEMTLEEYEKSLADKRGSLKKKPVNDVKVDTKAFEGMKVYKPTQEDNDLELSEKKVLGKSKSGSSDKARKEKELLPTGFRVGSDEGGRGRGRGDRGGRGGEFRDRPARRSDENGGGRGGRGYGRGDRPFSGGRGRGEGPLALDNKKAFPTLGGGNSPA